MAIVTVPAEARRITDPAAIKAFLADHGIAYDVWPLEDRVDPAAPADRILAAYAPEIDELKAKGGYVTADVINVTSFDYVDRISKLLESVMLAAAGCVPRMPDRAAYSRFNERDERGDCGQQCGRGDCGQQCGRGECGQQCGCASACGEWHDAPLSQAKRWCQEGGQEDSQGLQGWKDTGGGLQGPGVPRLRQAHIRRPDQVRPDEAQGPHRQQKEACPGQEGVQEPREGGLQAQEGHI
jgi:hypothetical protein